MKKENYRILKLGNKAQRRDYSKSTSKVSLPNLIEIQTNSFKWLQEKGMLEVFKEIFPISNYNGNVTLKFIDYYFKEPTHSIYDCKIKQLNYSAPLILKVELDVFIEETGEIIKNLQEDLFLGDFPLMTDTGTFIINGAERVIVSQIVRSPGAYYTLETDIKTGKDIFNSELIPSRGTWIDQKSETKKQIMGNIFNLRIDKKNKILNTILLKCIGASLTPKVNQDYTDIDNFKIFLQALDLKYDDTLELKHDKKSFTDHYVLLYSALFGSYDPIYNALHLDKIDTKEEALLRFHKNQKPDENAVIEGAISLMNAKFFESSKYDLNHAGRYKINKKLGVVDRIENNYLKDDFLDCNGKVLLKANTLITKVERKILIDNLKHGLYTKAYPFIHQFSHPHSIKMNTKYNRGLIGKILSKPYDANGIYIESNTIITQKQAEDLSKYSEDIYIYSGISANKVLLTPENVDSVLDYALRLYKIGRIMDKDVDLLFEDQILVDGYYPQMETFELNDVYKDYIKLLVNNKKEIFIYLVGATVVELNVISKENKVVKLIGNDILETTRALTTSDLYAFFSYSLTILDTIGNVDEIDRLSNRRVRTVGELIQNSFRVGLSRMDKNIKERMSINEIDKLTPKSLTNITPLGTAIKQFFSSSQLSQFMDQQNPLAELTNKRRISALGPGGLTRERASFEVRDVHNSSYARICPIETPEGPNIGLISNLTTYGKIDQYGFIITPYCKVLKDGTVSDEYIYLAAEEEFDYVIAQANEVIDGKLVNKEVVARKNEETILVNREDVDLVDVSPQQIVSVATACIPFLENDDASRALMGANMQRQAVPLIKPESPFVGTGIEYKIAKDSGKAIVASGNGIVDYVDSTKIVVKEKDQEKVYNLTKFFRSNAGTCMNHTPIVSVGEKINEGDILADGHSMQNGELALGQNVTIAFMTWHGYNYEDAIIMSERMVIDDIYTSIHIEEYVLECRKTAIGDEEITRDIPNVNQHTLRNLDNRGIVMVGAEVKVGDVLVGKITPKGHSDETPEEKLLRSIFGEKSKEVKDNSLKVTHGGEGIVQSIRVFDRKKGDILHSRVNKVVKVYIAQKRKISEGDKMAGRHGNKGVISKILPVEDMPYMADGTPIDIMLNPFGVPSRMNIGQVLEIHLGMAAKKLGVKFQTPVFDGISDQQLREIMEEANVSTDGKVTLYDGRTGEPYNEKISVGVMYMIKLAHMVDDKLHARSTGPYSLVTQQPLGGKAQNGGQRFGEMEVWALEAYGAAHTLTEILTIKSDDIDGRTKTYKSIIKGDNIPVPGLPESFRVLKNELKALAIDVKLLDEDLKEIPDETAIHKSKLIKDSYYNTNTEEEDDDDSIEINYIDSNFN